MWVYSDGEGRVCHRHAQVSGSGNWLWLQGWGASGHRSSKPSGGRSFWRWFQLEGVCINLNSLMASRSVSEVSRSQKRIICAPPPCCLANVDTTVFPAGGLSRALPKALQICSSGTCYGYRAIVVEIFELDEIKRFDGEWACRCGTCSPVFFRRGDQEYGRNASSWRRVLVCEAISGASRLLPLDRGKGRASPQGQGVARMMRSRWICRTAENLPLLEIPAATVLSCLQFSAVGGDTKALKSWWQKALDRRSRT